MDEVGLRGNGLGIITRKPCHVSRWRDLGKPCRVLQPTPQATYMPFTRKWKLRKPAAAYVLAVSIRKTNRVGDRENGGNESSRGFHTGTTIAMPPSE